MSDGDALSVRESVDWYGTQRYVREVTRPRRLARDLQDGR